MINKRLISEIGPSIRYVRKNAVCQWMKTSGYTKLSTKNNNEGEISVYWKKKTPFIIKAGVHFEKDCVIIAIGKE